MKALQRLSAFLAKETPWFVILVAVFAYFRPDAFGWVRGYTQTAILGIIMLTMGMTLTSADFRILAARPWDIAVGSLAQFAIMPLIALSLTHLLGLPRPVAVGLILVGCCPGGVSSNIMSFLCKGDVAFSVGITTLSTLFAPVTTPFLMSVLAGTMVDIDAVGMFKSVLLVTLLPVGLGFLFNTLWGRRVAYAEAMKVMPGVAVAGLACIVGGVVSAQGACFTSKGIALIFAGVFLHNALGYALGYACGRLARFTRPKKRTIAIEVGMQNAGLATVLATKHFAQLPEAAIASAVSCVWHSISGALLAGLFNSLDAWADRLGRLREGLKKLWQRLSAGGKLCLVVIAAYFALAVFGEVQYRLAEARDVTPAYNVVHQEARYQAPSWAHPMGTDNLGRDVALRLVQGSRIAFHVGIMTSLIAIPLGVVLGLLGGYFGGKVDSFVVWLCATVASMPGLLFILAISMVVGQGLLGIYMGIGLTTWVGVCRTIRAEVMKHKDRAYVQAARVLGYSHARIMFRHLLPNVAHVILIQFSIRFPSAVATEVFISFLGIGVQGEPSWGVMINNARLRLWQGVWWEMTFVTLAIFVLVLVFNHLADELRDLLDPALRNETH